MPSHDSLMIALAITNVPQPSVVGGKGASLIRLRLEGMNVPGGAVLTTALPRAQRGRRSCLLASRTMSHLMLLKRQMGSADRVSANCLDEGARSLPTAWNQCIVTVAGPLQERVIIQVSGRYNADRHTDILTPAAATNAEIAELAKSTRGNTTANRGPSLILRNYLPYRLSVLSSTIGASSAKLYARHFGFGLREWRAMAILGEYRQLAAVEIAELAKIDNGTATRALAKLVSMNLCDRRADTGDSRRVIFRLTTTGEEVYRLVCAGALKRERSLLESLGQDEREQLRTILEKLEAQAAKLVLIDPYSDHS